MKDEECIKWEMVCTNKECGYQFQLRKGERFAVYPQCYKCGNTMTREFLDN